MKTSSYTVLKFIMLTKACELKFFTYDQLECVCPDLKTDEAKSSFNLAFNAYASDGLIEFYGINSQGVAEFNIANINSIPSKLERLAGENSTFYEVLTSVMLKNEITD